MISIHISKYANNALVVRSKLLKNWMSMRLWVQRTTLICLWRMCIFSNRMWSASQSQQCILVRKIFTSKHYCQFRWSSGNYFNLQKIAILKIYNVRSKGLAGFFFFFLTPLYNLPSLLSSIDISSTSISESGLFLLDSYCDILGQS